MRRAFALAAMVAPVALAGAPSQPCAPGSAEPASVQPDHPDDGVLDLIGAERRLRYLRLHSNGPQGAAGGWQPVFPSDGDPPDDDRTLFLAGSAPAEGPALVADASFGGPFVGDLRNVTVTLYRGSFVEQHPAQERLRVSLAVGDTTLFDGDVDVAVTPGRPDVCHTGHYGSYRVGLWNVDLALARAGIAVGPDVQHDLTITFGPAGDGVSAPSLELFGLDTQFTPSSLVFNSSRPPVTFHDLAS